MNLKHLLECYKYKNITYNSITYEPDNRNIITIHFNEYVKAVCVSDDEVILKINILIENNREISNMTLHAINVLNIIACSLHCISNISIEEEKIILQSLGLYDGSFRKNKSIKHENTLYNCKLIDNILWFSIDKTV